ncbi:hypothetical protein NE237_028915 [Protea cynaroides]|uniref:Non-haem dioxygenase N-terminal domain-containing protein n=1 Tax=Protea cynaroides TaxID=273540 RepID=A0A9Q0JVR0_9MAGN|nr:hypothetical protein NE237_028915 [Protea cynaroides]
MTVDSVANSGHPVAPPSESVVFDASVLQHESNVSNIPKEFMWPEEELFSGEARELSVPIIDLGGFLSGDPVAVMESCKQVQEACEKHGFFLIVNHGVDEEFMTDVHRQLKWFFELPLSEKGRARREFGEYTGYASSLTNRFKSSLPWKETLSLPYIQGTNSVEDYLLKSYGDQFKEFG